MLITIFFYNRESVMPYLESSERIKVGGTFLTLVYTQFPKYIDFWQLCVQ